MLTASRKIDDLVPVAQRALERDNTLSAHAQELCCPEGAPRRVVCGIRYARVEANLIEAPPSRRTDCSSECNCIVVWKGISEGGTDRVERFCPSKKATAHLTGGSPDKNGPPQTITPPGPFGMSGGGQIQSLLSRALRLKSTPIARKKPCLGAIRRAGHGPSGSRRRR